MKEKILNEIVNNTIKLMSFKTVKENYKEFSKAFEFIKEQLNDYYIIEKEVNNYNNLIISNTKSKKLDVIFCTHIDVVESDKYEGLIKDGKIYGRGSFDMKGQLSVIMSLLKNNKIDKKIAFIITSDEEIGGACCKEILKNYDASLAVVPDAGKNFKLIEEEKGLLQIQIETKGIKAHASQPYNGENAILKNINIYKKIIKKYKQPKSDEEFKTTINLSKIEGGSVVNAVADNSKMILDIRFTSDIIIDNLLESIKKIAKDSIVTVLDSGPAFHVDIENDLIKKFIMDSKKILKKDIEIGKCMATSDAIYFSEKNIPAILINPCGNYWHSPNEYAEIDSYYTLYLLFKTLI